MVAQVFSRPRVLQVPWLLLDRGNFAQCKGLWASPPPLGWAPLVGNRRPIRTLAYSRPPCPLLSKGGGGPPGRHPWPSGISEGEATRSPPPESQGRTEKSPSQRKGRAHKFRFAPSSHGALPP